MTITRSIFLWALDDLEDPGWFHVSSRVDDVGILIASSRFTTKFKWPVMFCTAVFLCALKYVGIERGESVVVLPWESIATLFIVGMAVPKRKFS